MKTLIHQGAKVLAVGRALAGQVGFQGLLGHDRDLHPKHSFKTTNTVVSFKTVDPNSPLVKHNRSPRKRCLPHPGSNPRPVHGRENPDHILISLILALGLISLRLPAEPASLIHLRTESPAPILLPTDPVFLEVTTEVPGASIVALRMLDINDREVFSLTSEVKNSEIIPAWGFDLLSGSPDAEASPKAPFRIDAPPGHRLVGDPAVDYTPRFGLFGVFRVQVRYLDQSGAEVQSAETTLARIPDVRLSAFRPDSPFGIGSYFAARFNPRELAVGTWIQQTMGAAWTREEFLWDYAEPQPGQWQWERFDRTLRAARQHNLLILGLLDYWGKWAEPFTDEGYAAYANFVKRMVERYKPGGVFARQEGWTDGYGISHWEIWNEPATFWTGSGAQFGRLLKQASAAAKQADPDCMVFFSEAGRRFNAEAIAAAGTGSFDGITPHYYCPPRSPEEGETDKLMKNTPSEFAELGVTGKPFWVSEFGWNSSMDPQQMRNQAVFLVRSHVYGLASGLDKFFWYNFVNDTPDKHYRHFGLINREDWTPRFGFGSYASMVHFLDRADFHSRVEIVRPARIFVFRKENGSVAVLWSSGAEGRLQIKNPNITIRLYDMMGNPMPADEDPGAHGNAMNPPKPDSRAPAPAKDLSIPLGAQPVYLVAEDLSAAGLTTVLESGVTEGISPAEIRVLPLVGSLDSNPPVCVEVSNVGRAPIAGRVRLEPPEGWTARETEQTLDSVAPGTTTLVRFSFTRQTRQHDNLYRVRAEFQDQHGNVAVGESRLSEHVALHGTPVIDGDPSDWEGVPRVRLDTPDKAVGLVPYMDWNLSTEFALQWDEKNLYFLGRVRDNAFDQSHTGSLIWEGDSFQIAFDTRAQKVLPPSEDVAGLYLYGLAKTSHGTEAWSWPTPGNRHERSAPEIQFQFANPEKDVYLYEAAIPRDLLAPLRMKASESFGFSLLLNDNDGGGRRGWLELTPGIGTGFDPKHFLTWTLVDKTAH